MLSVKDIEEIELKTLKPYACFSRDIRRFVNNNPIDKHPCRTEFQRDRDRILHSKAFRRLENKTQVFLSQRGDHLRTRLTHSLEVAQLARTCALQLGLNVDLTEAIALGHDLGHTPFGHAGERELKEICINEGLPPFKHNIQSVRIAEKLERKYDYDGLALTLPVKEGMLKHTSIFDKMPDYCKDLYIDKPFSVTLEGQIVAITDEIAQVTHDMDDYLRYNIIHYSELLEHPLFDEVEKFFLSRRSDFKMREYIKSIKEEGRQKDTTIRCLVDFLTSKLIFDTAKNIEEGNQKDIKAFELKTIYADFRDPFKTLFKEFHKYLYGMIFTDFRLTEMDKRGRDVIKNLYYYFKTFPDKLPDETQAKYKNYQDDQRNIVIIDYISGMTDRYAIEQYKSMIRLF